MEVFFAILTISSFIINFLVYKRIKGSVSNDWLLEVIHIKHNILVEAIACNDKHINFLNVKMDRLNEKIAEIYLKTDELSLEFKSFKESIKPTKPNNWENIEKALRRPKAKVDHNE